MNYAVFDIESNDWTRFEVMGFYDGQEYRTFNSVKNFIRHITRSKYDGYRIYAHNGGRFDFLFILESLLDLAVKIKIIERGGSLIAIRLTTKKVMLTFADSYALLPASLKELTHTFNTVHKKREFKFNKYKKISRHDRKLMQYLESDVRGLYEVLMKFFVSDFVVKPQLTLASQSMNTFREKFLKYDLEQLELREENLIRDRFYSGGRVEVYKAHGKNIHIYDINSLYPFVMLNAMPCGIPTRVERYERGKIGFYCIDVTSVPDFYISPLLHKRQNGQGWKNYYCNGKGEYYLSSATIDFCVKFYGMKFKVLFGYVFPRREVLFKEFVDTFYKIKSENPNSALGYIAKIFLNSLYGKFGQMRFRETIELWSKDLKDFVEFDSYYALMAVTRESHSKFILPYLAAYITDLARLEHYRYLMLQPEDMYYCDTDSLFTTNRMPYDLHCTSEIGQLKYEGCYEGIFLTSKTYALRNLKEEIIVFKGFDSSNFRFSDFEEALYGGKILSDVKESPMSFKQCQQYNRMKEEGKTSRVNLVREDGRYLKVSRTEKQLVSLYDRRRMFTPHEKYRFETLPFNREEL